MRTQPIVRRVAVAVLAATAMLWAGNGLALAADSLANVDHYRCYDVDQHGSLDPHLVVLKDQFLSSERKVLRITSICAPTLKHRPDIGEVIEPQFPDVHLVCYELEPTEFVGDDVEIRSQFGRARMTVAKEETLCVPALKRHLQ